MADENNGNVYDVRVEIGNAGFSISPISEIGHEWHRENVINGDRTRQHIFEWLDFMRDEGIAALVKDHQDNA